MIAAAGSEFEMAPEIGAIATVHGRRVAIGNPRL
jgi:hypothetical protein